jgi:hypothetical protein
MKASDQKSNYRNVKAQSYSKCSWESLELEAYKPVFQGDNAGPYIDAAYLAGIKGQWSTGAARG